MKDNKLEKIMELDRKIEVINQIQENLKLDNDFEIKNKIELANCYFHIGNENKARKLILDFIELYDKWKNNRTTIEF